MITRIESVVSPLPSHLGPSPKQVDSFQVASTITSLQVPTSARALMKGILSFFLWPVRKLYEKMAPTLQELERFEDLVAMAASAAQVYIGDPRKGEGELRKVITFANSLDRLFSGKWLSWTEGILYMRGHLIKINLSLNALVGDDREVLRLRERLKRLGYVPRGDLDLQLSYIRQLQRRVYRWPLKVGGFLIKPFL